MLQFIHDDCLDALGGLSEQSVDLVLADPPYGVTRNQWDVELDIDALWPALWRVCRGPIVLTARQPFSAKLVCSQIKYFRHEWIWKKNKATGHMNAKRAPMLNHETVLVFSKQAPVYNPQMTVGHKPVNAYTRRNNGANYGPTVRQSGGGSTMRYPRTVQQFDVVNGDDPTRVHPTQKPIDMLAYFIRTYSNAGGTVLDFCAGSGSTGLAALREGRRCILIERDPVYADHIKNLAHK